MITTERKEQLLEIVIEVVKEKLATDPKNQIQYLKAIQVLEKERSLMVRNRLSDIITDKIKDLRNYLSF